MGRNPYFLHMKPPRNKVAPNFFKEGDDIMSCLAIEPLDCIIAAPAEGAFPLCGGDEHLVLLIGL
jgi:hypothetical protein